MSEPIIKCESIFFSKLFERGKFEVPWHQRYYDWGAEHVSDLLRDINEAVGTKERCYFLGSIMLVGKDGDSVCEINDGQQRMITYSLICARFSRFFYERNASRNESYAIRVLFDVPDTHTDTLANVDDLTSRLTPPRSDKERYRAMIRNRDIGGNGKLTAAWNTIDTFISEKETNTESINSYFDFLINKVEVACLYIPKSKISPNSIFEVINCRGKKLSDFDLIRNYLYSHFNADDKKDRRDTVHVNLEKIKLSLSSSDRSAGYSRCYFQCRYGFLAKDRFYREMRNNTTEKISASKQKPADYIFKLISDYTSDNHLNAFHLIKRLDIHHQIIEGFIRDSRTRNNKRNLQIFLQELHNYTVTFPILFALLCKYLKEKNDSKRKDLSRKIHIAIKKLNAFVMRTAFIAKFESSHYEREFSDFARRIWNIVSLDDLKIDEFIEECDSEGEQVSDNNRFKKRLMETEIKASLKAKTFLYGINCFEQSDGNLININNCTLEHIFPKSQQHQSSWEHFNEHKPTDWIYRIGNLTLLGETDNKPDNQTNRDFLKKKKIFTNSSIKLTRDIAEYDQWSPSEIEERQHKLTKTAIKVWSIK